MSQSNFPDAPKKVFKIKRFEIGLNVLIQVLVLMGIVVMVNYLSFRHFQRWDYSRDRKYALSSQTKNLLTNLKMPVQAVVFFSSAAELAPDLTALLREYQFTSKGKFTTELVDPFRNFTRANELQAKYKFGANENILILDFGGKSKFINAADLAEFEQPDQMAMMAGQTQPRLKAFKGEQAITSALLELKEDKPNKVYMLSGHGEPGLDTQETKVFAETLKRQNIQASNLSLLNVNAIPEDARAVVIWGPKYDLSELEMKLLSDFWEKKGRILVMLNPFVSTPRLNGWLAHQGVIPQTDRVIRTGTFLAADANGNPQLRTGTVAQAAFVVSDSGTNITKDLAGASQQLLGVTESLRLDRGNEAASKSRIIELARAAEGYWGEVDPIESAEHPAFFDPKKDHAPPLVISAAVEKGGVTDNRVKVDTSRLVVFGNSELLTNNGYRLSEGVTMDLGMNALNWLLDREELVGIPPKEKKMIALSLDDRELKRIAFGSMVLVPGFVALLGLFTWWRRRA